MKVDKSSIKILSELFDYPNDEFLINSQSFLSISEDITLLQQEYTRLFINSFPTLLCPPYASYYLEGVIKGLTTLKIEELYEKYGFTPKNGVADFISFELEFLYFLLNLKEYNDIKEIVEKDLIFLLNHLTYWTNSFFKDIIKYTKIDFYKELAKKTDFLLRKLHAFYAT